MRNCWGVLCITYRRPTYSPGERVRSPTTGRLTHGLYCRSDYFTESQFYRTTVNTQDVETLLTN